MKREYLNALTLTSMATIFLLSACDKDATVPVSQKTIKLMFRDEESYRREYANVLDYKFPDLHIEVVSYAELMQPGKLNPEGFYDFIHTNKPDIVTILPVPGLFEQLIEQGSLLALDNFIAKDKFDIDQFAPLVTTLLRAKGQGSLYGLPTSFSNQALYYNKRLFDEFKIAYPHNGMSFEEVLQLAYRFTERQTEQPVAGFYKKGMTPGEFLLYAGDLLGLQWIDSVARNITIDTPAWAKVFTNVTGAYKSGAIFDANVLQSSAANAQTVKDFELMIEQSRKNNLFAAGKAAMTLESSGFINEMTSLQTNIDWDLAPLPASENKLPSSLVQFDSIYSIYSGTLQTEDSWKVVQFLNSDAMAKTNTAALTFGGKLPVRMKYLPDLKGRNLKAFYSLNTEERVVSPVQLPPVFLQAFHDLLNKAISDVLGNRQTVSEAIQAIQEQGGGLLLQHIEK